MSHFFDIVLIMATCNVLCDTFDIAELRNEMNNLWIAGFDKYSQDFVLYSCLIMYTDLLCY